MDIFIKAEESYADQGIDGKTNKYRERRSLLLLKIIWI